MLRKLIIGSAKLCFGVFVVILIGCLIAYIVSHNFMDYVDSYGPEKFMDEIMEFFNQFI